MEIDIVRVDQAALNTLPEDERRAFFAFGFLANEITCLQRLSYWCVAATECSDAIEYEARTSQVLFLLRMKIGKLSEAFRTLNKFYYSGLSQKYKSKLAPEARKALKEFKRTLKKKKHPFNQIRDKVSFHADDDALYANASSKTPEGADLRIYMTGRRTNWLWQYADIGIIGVLTEITGRSAFETIDFCVNESGRLADLLLLFIENWMALALQKHFPGSLGDMERVTLSGLVPVNAVSIPFFTEELDAKIGDDVMPFTIRFPAPAPTS